MDTVRIRSTIPVFICSVSVLRTGVSGDQIVFLSSGVKNFINILMLTLLSTLLFSLSRFLQLLQRRGLSTTTEREKLLELDVFPDSPLSEVPFWDGMVLLFRYLDVVYTPRLSH